MKISLVAVLAATAILAVAVNAQTGQYPNFPYAQCTRSPAAYSLAPTVRAMGRGRFCFTVNVRPPAGCTSYCCSRADLRKIEFNVNPSCDIFGVNVRATVNGVFTPVAPSFDYAAQGPATAKILRVTQLGLNQTNDGAEVCVILARNKDGEGCMTLEDLCVPPSNMPTGVCAAALFDKNADCCPISYPNVPSPPPPSPPPPSPPPPSPPPPSPPPPSPPPPSPPPPSPPPPSPPPPSPPPPSPPPPSPPPPSPPPPSPPPPSPPPPPPPSPPPPSPPPPSPPPPPPPSPPPPSPPPPSPPPPPPPSPPPPPPPSPPPPSPPPPSPPPPPPPSPPPPPPPSPPPPSPPPPPPPSPPPPSPPPPSPPPQCTVCTTLSLIPGNVIFPFTIDSMLCNAYAYLVAEQVTAAAEEFGSVMLDVPPAITCEANEVRVCGVFLSAAEAQKLQDWLNEQVKVWLEVAAGPGTCPSYLNDYTVTVEVGSPIGAPGCVEAFASVACAPEAVPFPKCECDTNRLATPFVVKPTMWTMAGRKRTTQLHCFSLDTMTPSKPTSSCGRTTTLLKAEVWANEDLRRSIEAIGVQAAGAAKMSFRTPSWGAVGEQTLKVSALNWSKAQAKNATICLEIAKSTSLGDFCNSGDLPTCWMNLFDPSIKCCPLFSSTEFM